MTWKTEHASLLSKQASEAVTRIETILTSGLDSVFIWDTLKDSSDFDEPKPQLQLLPIPDLPEENEPKPQLQFLPIIDPPKITDHKYQAKLDIIERISPEQRQEWRERVWKAEQEDYAAWQKKNEETIWDITRQNNELEKEYQDNVRKWEERRYEAWEKKKENITQQNQQLEREYQDNVRKWGERKQDFLRKQKEQNDDIQRISERYYIQRLPDAIVEHCERVLFFSTYPDYFSKKFALDYNLETKTLVVDYSLPCPDDLPKVKEVRYRRAIDEFEEISLSAAGLNRLYESLIYQVTLRTIHEIFRSDTVETINSIVFNGWVESINKANGHKTNACILSVHTSRKEFCSIDLRNVDPKTCFKGLKGIGSSRLYALTPVAPILNLNREDKRFISSYGVASELNDSVNIAAMDWGDFEHLIRELFEEEFSQYGGEVKITQASKDRGVDAVAFDPDPIRGGKIVIQAKRYTNTVGVSAVRDLYGTALCANISETLSTQ